MHNKDKISTTKIAIIGAGFGGIAMAIRLQQSGIHDFVILEKSNDIGGTWRDNQYPGAACDVQSHLYSLSFAPKKDWSKRYADAHEIYTYLHDLMDQFQLDAHTHLHTEVTAAHYIETECHWQLSLNQHESLIAQYVIFASGPLHVPQIPHIQGIENFKGKVFHSAQWDHQYDLNNKRVASIGTGGSAIQYIPEIAPQCKELYVLQRSAAWIIPRDERRYLDLEQTLFKKMDWVRKLHRSRLYWSNESRLLPSLSPVVVKYVQKLAHAFIRLQVKDPKIAEKLTPDYVMGCKRILVSNRYFPTFNRSNVHLITEGIDHLTEHSIKMKNGQEYPIDCLIFGTGFITDPRIYLKKFVCQGRNNVTLNDVWKDCAESFYGICTKQFPNFFQLLGPNTLLGHNSVIFIIESQVEYILQMMNLVEETNSQAIVIKDQVQDRFNQSIESMLKDSVWQSGCVSWYQQENGKNFALWPTFTWKYWLQTKTVNPNDFELLRATHSLID